MIRPPLLLVLFWLLVGAASLARPQARATAQTAPRVPLATSTFDTDAEGWTTDGDARCRPTPCHAATDGSPGGHTYSEDSLQGVKFYFNAPATFLGNMSAAYGGHLTFKMRQDARDDLETDDIDVLLEGADLRLVYDTPRNPPSIWFTYDILLTETAGWRKGTITGPAPTAAEMQAVLTSLSRLAIRGDYIYGQATTSLDTVVLGGPEVPEVQVHERFFPVIRK